MINSRLFVEQRSPTIGSPALEFWNFLGAGLGLMGSLAGSSTAAQNTRRTNEMNLAIASKNNASQERIAKQNNQTQIDMMRENNAWSAQQADIAWNRDREAFRQEAEYNSIGAQAQRALAAGINPAAIFGNGSSATASMSVPSAPSAAGSTISPSMPNFVTPTMMTPPSVLLGSVDAISKLAGAASSLATAKKTGKEANRYDEWMDATLENLFSQAANADAQAAYQTLQTKIDALWLPRKYKQEIATSFMEGYKAMMQGKESEANIALRKVEELLTNERYKILQQQGPALVQEVEENVKLVQEKQKTEETQQEANRATSRERNTQADVNIEQKEKTKQETDRLKIENKYIDDIDAAAYADKRADVIAKLRSAYRTGHGLYDSVRDFAHSIMRKLGMDPHNRPFESLEELADEIIKNAKEANK